MKRVEFRSWDLPEKYDPDYKLHFKPDPPTFKLQPPLSTKLETQKPAYGACWANYHGTKLAPIILLEVRRTGKKRFSVCVVKTPGGIILRKLANRKTRAEADLALKTFLG